MFDAQVLASYKQQCNDLSAHLNDENVKRATEQYSQWKQQADVATAKGQPAPPKAPYPTKSVVTLDATGWPLIEWSKESVFVEPVPVVVPLPQDTLTYTKDGVTYKGTIIGQTPFGLAITWVVVK